MFLVLIIGAQHYGWRRPIYDTPVPEAIEGLKLSFVLNMMFAQAGSWSKASILWFARRLVGKASGGTYRAFFPFWLSLLVIVILCDLLFIVLSCFECRYIWKTLPQIYTELILQTQAPQSSLHAEGRFSA